MKHVFVETNWVVSYCAPPHACLPAAVELARKAEKGEVQLYLPSICLTEANRPIRTKYKTREAADSVGMDVFALNEQMLSRAVDLATTKDLDLKPFDQAILAAVLVRAESLRGEGAEDILFCELDSDLQYWDKHGNMKEPLAGLYKAAGILIYGDFAFQVTGPRPSRTTH